MIYPEFFPDERKNEIAEKKVFDRLKQLSNQYDIFYSRKFITDGIGKKPEYEIDFIIALPQRAILCLEVKGGIINYSGMSDTWTQNGKTMSKRPDSQASSAAHALISEFRELLNDMAVGWALCFPDGDLSNKQLPTSINVNQIIDQLGLLHIDDALDYAFKFVQQQNIHRSGTARWKYEKFKTELLRDIGFVQVLSTQIKYNEERFIQLTERQIEVFNRLKSNKNIITSGPAGSGKTIVAKTLAHELIKEGKSVLFLCYNRTLANKIRYDFDRDEALIEVSTFHSLSRKIIENYDMDWWKSNSNSEDFWDLEVPVKLEECLIHHNTQYDAIIIDEAQDFKEFWFELIFSMATPEASKHIFMDQMQDIFGRFTQIPQEKEFMKYSLPENCRNTRNIVKYLSETINQDIVSFANSPEGDKVVRKNFKNQIEEQRYLLNEIQSLTREQGIESNQILILLNSPKEESCLNGIPKIGKLEFKSMDRKARFYDNTIHYTNIATFKGLEADIVFIVDADKIPEEQKIGQLYTEASRARHKLYVLFIL